MRRVVNMLQSLSMLGTDEQISEDTVYSFTGNPSPATLKQYMEILLNDDIQTAYAKLQIVLKENGISMQSIVR